MEKAQTVDDHGGRRSEVQHEERGARRRDEAAQRTEGLATGGRLAFRFQDFLFHGRHMLSHRTECNGAAKAEFKVAENADKPLI